MNSLLNDENIYKSRNKFFMDHYELFDKLANIYAKKVYRKYAILNFSDLVAYALEGIVVALDRVDLKNEAWMAFVRRYAYLYTINGAFTMLGGQRIRSKQYGPGNKAFISCCDSIQLTAYADRIAADDYSSMDRIMGDIIRKDQITWFMKKLKHTLQYRMIKCLIAQQSIARIAKECCMSPRKVRRIILELPILFKMALDNTDISHYLIYVSSPAAKIHVVRKAIVCELIRNIRHRLQPQNPGSNTPDS